jgi:hypothetical protein
MSEMITVTAVDALEGYRIRVAFSDGAVKEIDLTDLVGRARGVFHALADPKVFKQVQANPETGTVEWPGEVDFDPEVLYGRFEPASGVRIERRTVRDPAPSAR